MIKLYIDVNMEIMNKKENYRIICLGDTHGRVTWKEIVAKEASADRIIFIGDYFDSHNRGVSGNKQIVNFKEILEFKKSNPDKVILLTGNHDYHYIRGVGETYSGYQGVYALEIGELVEQAIKDDLMQMCYLHDKFFFSHAGLTKTWVQRTLTPNNINPLVNDIMIQQINDYLKFQPRVFGFAMGNNFDQTGDDITQGPIWVRPYSLTKDMVEEITCVVGHTQVKKLGINTALPNLILTDCLGSTGEYLIIENGIPKSSK
jgi:predicted MPP superfamily phosphohydrolase